MSETELDALLNRMPQIAAAVNQFSAEPMQSEVFRALMQAFGVLREEEAAVGSGTSKPDTPGATTPVAETTPPNPAAKNAAVKKQSASKGKQSVSVDKELDLIKGGDPPFSEFWKSKKPTSQEAKCLICVYWLSRKTHAKHPVTIEQVYTCFKDAGWVVPSNLANTLAQAGTKGWLDRRKRDDLKVVVGNENFVDHQMPAKPKAS